MAQNISAEQVRAKIQRYWNALAKKSKEELSGFYAPDAIVLWQTRAATSLPG